MNASILTLAALCCAQETPRDQGDTANGMRQANRSVQRLETIGHLTDCDVRIVPGSTERRESLQSGEQAEQPSVDLEQLLINLDSGEAAWALVSVGGFLGIGERDVLVPYDSLAWNADEEYFELSTTKRQLEMLPAFDMSKAMERGLDAQVRECAADAGEAGYAVPASYRKGEGTWSDTDRQSKRRDDSMNGDRQERGREDAANDQGDRKRRAGLQMPAGYGKCEQRLVGSDYALSADIDTATESMGDVEELVIDPQSGELSFAIVGIGGVLGLGESSVVVPAEHLSLLHRVDDDSDDEGVWYLPIDAKQLEQLPKYEKPESGVIDAAAWQRAKQSFEGLVGQDEGQQRRERSDEYDRERRSNG